MSYGTHPRQTAIFPASSAGAPGATLRQPNVGSQQPQVSQQQSAILSARIASKKAELESLRQLRDLSGALAGQMSQLEQKLATLRDGTEAVATVLSNWDHVLKAINLASVKAAKVASDSNGQTSDVKDEHEPNLPVALIRIPMQEKATMERVIQAQHGEGEAKAHD